VSPLRDPASRAVTDILVSVAVFSKSYCPYCRATKQLLNEMGAKYYAIELDQEREFTYDLLVARMGANG
jgi:glutaredoxin